MTSWFSGSVFSNWDFAVREQGLQLDQPPAIRNISFIMIVIHKNDNAEGIVEFDPDYINITGKHNPLQHALTSVI